MCSGAVHPSSPLTFSFSASVWAIDGILKSFEFPLEMLDPRLTRRQPALPTRLSRPPGSTAAASPVQSVGIFRTSQPSVGVPAREREGRHPLANATGPAGFDRCLKAPRLGAVCASVALGLGMKSRPRGQLATTCGTPSGPGTSREATGATRCAATTATRTSPWTPTTPARATSTAGSSPRARPRADDYRDPLLRDQRRRRARAGRRARLPAHIWCRSRRLSDRRPRNTYRSSARGRATLAIGRTDG
jgi:hypothetical protein